MRIIEVRAPCCYSERECEVKRRLIIDPDNGVVVKEIRAVNCHRYRAEKVFNVPSRYAVVDSYLDGGDLQLRVIHLPPGVSEDGVKLIVTKYLRRRKGKEAQGQGREIECPVPIEVVERLIRKLPIPRGILEYRVEPFDGTELIIVWIPDIDDIKMRFAAAAYYDADEKRWVVTTKVREILYLVLQVSNVVCKLRVGKKVEVIKDVFEEEEKWCPKFKVPKKVVERLISKLAIPVGLLVYRVGPFRDPEVVIAWVPDIDDLRLRFVAAAYRDRETDRWVVTTKLREILWLLLHADCVADANIFYGYNLT